jgi:hypothetical protein
VTLLVSVRARRFELTLATCATAIFEVIATLDECPDLAIGDQDPERLALPGRFTILASGCSRIGSPAARSLDLRPVPRDRGSFPTDLEARVGWVVILTCQ